MSRIRIKQVHDAGLNLNDSHLSPTPFPGLVGYLAYDITIGKMLSGNKVVLSGSFAGKLFGSSHYELYHKQFQFRIGYFF